MKTKIRVLHLEDDPDDAFIIEEEIDRGGYDAEILRVDSQNHFLDALTNKKWDIILSDYNLPGEWNGMDALHAWHEQKSDVPYIFISGTLGEDKAVEAMRLGACDYMIKGNLKKLVPTITRELREAETRRDKHLAQEALRETEERFQAFMDNTPAVVFIKDYDGRYVFINQTWEKVFNIKQEDIQGKMDSDFWEKEVADRLKANDAQVIKTKKPVSVIEKIIPSNGAQHDWMVVKFPLRIGNKERFIGGVAIDITEQKRLEGLHKLSEAKYKTIFDSTGTAVALIEEDTTISLVNNIFERLSGYSKQEIEGRMSWTQFVTSNHLEKMKVYHRERRVDPENVPKSYEFKFENRMGNVRDVFMTVELIPGTKTTLASLIDITERKQSEAKVQEQAALLDITRDAISVRNMEHEILYWNKGAEAIYGYLSQEILGKKPSDFLFKDVKEFQAARRAVLDNGSWNGELHKINKRGKEILVASRWTLICDEQRRPKSVLVIDTDITEQKQLEMQFLRTQRMESIGTLAGGIAHDLNNVLGPVLLATQILRKKLPSEEDQKILNMLESSAKRGADIVKQVLTFARGSEGEKIPVHYKHLVKEMADIARETFNKSIQIQTELEKDMWQVIGDPTQLHQILLNLCINARDAMPNGGTLSIKVSNFAVDEQYAKQNADAKKGNYILCSVTDTGSGIPPEILDKIFEPFFTTKEVGKGTGLGLSTVIGIVKWHEGFITVKSAVGSGTTFNVYLPALKPTGETGSVSVVEEIPQGHGELILVVDDEVGIRNITQTTLEGYNYRTLIAADGTEALSHVARHHTDIKLILTDMIMPFMDGTAMIRAIKKIAPSIKIIAMSGSIVGIKSIDPNLRVNHFIQKPFTASVLLKLIHAVLNEK